MRPPAAAGTQMNTDKKKQAVEKNARATMEWKIIGFN
jgi:hypothetical protein